MLTIRAIDIESDKGTLLELHCCGNYESDTPWARTVSYEQYREKWLNTLQPESFLSHLAEAKRIDRLRSSGASSMGLRV